MIQENYGGLSVEDVEDSAMRMNSQPKSEQKFRSQTNDHLNRRQNLDPNNMTIGASVIQKNNAKKTAVKAFLE